VTKPIDVTKPITANTINTSPITKVISRRQSPNRLLIDPLDLHRAGDGLGFAPGTKRSVTNTATGHAKYIAAMNRSKNVIKLNAGKTKSTSRLIRKPVA
jgi:hypothetical protein